NALTRSSWIVRILKRTRHGPNGSCLSCFRKATEGPLHLGDDAVRIRRIRIGRCRVVTGSANSSTCQPRSRIHPSNISPVGRPSHPRHPTPHPTPAPPPSPPPPPSSTPPAPSTPTHTTTYTER